jgi:hypothetical protein
MGTEFGFSKAKKTSLGMIIRQLQMFGQDIPDAYCKNR